MPKALLGVLGVLVLHAPAFARIPRHARPDPQIQVVLSEAVKPYVPADPGNPRSTPTAITVDDVLEGLAGPVRTEQEQLIGQLIAETSDAHVEEKSDYYFRLGELYAKQQRHWRGRSIELRRLADHANDAAQRTRLTTEAATAENKAKDYLLKAVKTFKALTDNESFRAYPRMDTALFYFGYTLQSGKYMKEARAVYHKLLKNFPASKHVPEAHLAFADYFFDAGQLADAEAHFKLVLKFPKSSVYWYASYKLGRIQLQLQRYQESLEAFFAVAQATRTAPKQASLNRAAKLDFARAYAEIGPAEKAFAAFQRVDPAAALELLDELAHSYVEQGKHDRAVYVLRELIAKAPADPRVCAWQYTAARTMLSAIGAATADKIAEIEKLVKVHRGLEATHSLPAREAQQCGANAAAMSGELARAFHDEWKKTRNPVTLASAIRLYRAFLDSFPDDARRAELEYLHAEALWASAAGERNDRIQDERWERAADAFTELASNDPARASDAAHAAVLAWMNTLASDAPTDAVDFAKRTKREAARPLPSREARLVEAIAAYASTVRDPGRPELGEMRYLEAKLYRRFHHHDKAAPLFVGLLTTHRDAAFAEAVALRALDSLISLQRIDEMLMLADKLAADPAFLADKPELERAIRHVRSRSMRRGP